MLEAQVRALMDEKSASGQAENRRQQVGSGQRGDKVRAYRERDDLVSDHRTGHKARLTQIRQGHLELLAQ